MQEAYLLSPCGPLRIRATDSALLSVHFLPDDILAADDRQGSFEHAVLHEAVRQLGDYFAGRLRQFDLPLEASGTAFQQKVWNELMRIPFGETCTYAQLAHRLGDLLCIRAAASANGQNPWAIVVPCHRVIGADGKLTGYAGGLHRKSWLLRHEASLGGRALQQSLFPGAEG